MAYLQAYCGCLQCWNKNYPCKCQFCDMVRLCMKTGKFQEEFQLHSLQVLALNTLFKHVCIHSRDLGYNGDRMLVFNEDVAHLLKKCVQVVFDQLPGSFVYMVSMETLKMAMKTICFAYNNSNTSMNFACDIKWLCKKPNGLAVRDRVIRRQLSITGSCARNTLHFKKHSKVFDTVLPGVIKRQHTVKELKEVDLWCLNSP